MAEVEWLHSPERGGECGLTVQGELGVSLSARTVKNQKVEAAIKCAVLKRMAELGMPRSERVY